MESERDTGCTPLTEHGQRVPTCDSCHMQEVPDKRGPSPLQGVLGQLASWQLEAAQ